MDAYTVDVVVAAVSAGAAAGLKSTATQTDIKDAYAELKKLIAARYGHVDVGPVEKRPESAAKRDSLAEDLQDAGADGDAEVVAAAQRVLTAVAEHAPEVGPVIGVDLVGLSAANVRLHDITAVGRGAIGLRVGDMTVSGDFDAGRIRAIDRAVGPPDPPAR